MKLTPEQKQEWLDAALAFVEGEPIQYQLLDGTWEDTVSITLTRPHRRKPDPLAEVKAALKAEKRVEYNIHVLWSGRDPEWVPVTASQNFELPPHAYRIAPWTLPEPPAGQQWHRTDGWTEDMLPDGWRPLLLGEIAQQGDEAMWALAKGIWHTGVTFDRKGDNYPAHHYRTRRPLPAPPRMVPLEAEDLIGCVLRGPSGTAGWIAIEGAAIVFVYIAPAGLYERSIPFANLQTDGWTYHRIGDRDADDKPVWRRCEKEAK